MYANIEVEYLFLLEKASNIREKGFFTPIAHQILKSVKYEKVVSPTFQFGTKNGSPALGNSLFYRCHQIG